MATSTAPAATTTDEAFVTEPRVRRATLADLSEVRALLVELGYASLATDEHLAPTFEEVLADPSRSVWLAEAEGAPAERPLGMISLASRVELRLAGARLTVEELVVRETARGRGVGTLLLETAKSEARRLGARRIELLTNRDRDAYRRRFYVERGFVEARSAVMRWVP